MNLRVFILGFVFIYILPSCLDEEKVKFDVDKELAYCNIQIHKTIKEISASRMLPYCIEDTAMQWSLIPIEANKWTSGFWPGILWYDYGNTKDSYNQDYATYYTSLLHPLVKMPVYDHCLAFQLFHSYGNGYRFTGNENYKEVVLNTAENLSSLFNPKIGAILSSSYDIETADKSYYTTIDNIVNLEMLYWAAKYNNNKELYNVATQHAETMMRNHFRDNGSVCYMVVYDSVSGAPINKVTTQKYNDNDRMLTRNLAWAIYGYTIVLRETKDHFYLRLVEKMTDLYLSQLPEGEYIPYWDLEMSNLSNRPKDTFSAAIVASAFLELSQLDEDEERAYKYESVATRSLIELSGEKYQSRERNSSFLSHSRIVKSTGLDVPASTIYTDYYYIEALTRYKRLKRGLSVVRQTDNND